MKITKLGHCCLIIEVKGEKIMTDPGAWTDYPSEITGITAIIISHEHNDHVHVESLKQIILQNPKAIIYANSGVGRILETANINFHPLDKAGTFNINKVIVSYFSCDHATIYPGIAPVENTPFLIDNSLFYPGDSFFIPNLSIETLALPVSGGWLRLDESVNYAKQLCPKFCFPVHDGMLKHLGSTHIVPEKFLASAGIVFKPLNPGETVTF